MNVKQSPSPYGTAVPSAGLSSAIDPDITSLDDLAAVPTVSLPIDTIRVWVMAADGTSQVWQLSASTAATIEGSIQRPDDYNDPDNAKVWHKASS